MNQNYALIIGVHDYRTYDPSGGSNVPGALHDARTWYRACLSMGFSPENIRVLASPPLSPDELGPGGAKATLGEATRAGIAKGLLWLSEKIGVDTPASGLMTFSGHGDEGDAGRPVLFPSDTTASLEEGIDVAALWQKASTTVADNLTMMLDCCSAQAGVSAAESMRGRMRARRDGVSAPEPSRARVVAACQRDQESVSARFLGEEMGAFTWAVASTLGQWKTVVEDGVARLDVSHGDVVARTQALLSALSFEQEPALSGPEGVAELSFLHPGTAGTRGETDRAPTAERKGHQLDGGELPVGTYQWYRVDLWHDNGNGSYSGQQIVDIYVTASDMGETPPKIGNTEMVAGTEYWSFFGTWMTTLKSDSANSGRWLQVNPVEISSADVHPDSGGSFTARELVDWTEVSQTRAPAGAFTYSGGDGTLQGIVLQYEGDTPTAWWWVQTGQENLTSQQLSTAKLYLNENPLGNANNYYAASAFDPIDPNA